jgi:TonB family protein
MEYVFSTVTSLWSKLDTYLPWRYFAAMVALAALLHIFGLVVLSVIPASPVIETPVKVLNIRLGDDLGTSTDAALLGDSGAAIEEESATVSELLNHGKIPVPVSHYVREGSQKKSGKGKKDGSGSKGSPLGNSTAADAEIMARYEQLISLWIEKHRIYPQQARDLNLEGEAIIRLRIDRAGNIQQISLHQSAGNPLLDRAALQMAQKANPVPAVPSNYPPGDVLEFLVPVSFKLQ